MYNFDRNSFQEFLEIQFNPNDLSKIVESFDPSKKGSFDSCFFFFFFVSPDKCHPLYLSLAAPQPTRKFTARDIDAENRAAGSADKAELPEIGGAPEAEAAPSLDTRLLSIIARPVKNRHLLSVRLALFSLQDIDNFLRLDSLRSEFLFTFVRRKQIFTLSFLLFLPRHKDS